MNMCYSWAIVTDSQVSAHKLLPGTGSGADHSKNYSWRNSLWLSQVIWPPDIWWYSPATLTLEESRSQSRTATSHWPSDMPDSLHRLSPSWRLAHTHTHTHLSTFLPHLPCMQGCLVMEPAGRLTCDELLDHSYFDVFRDWFQPELEVYTVSSTPSLPPSLLNHSSLDSLLSLSLDAASKRCQKDSQVKVQSHGELTLTVTNTCISATQITVPLF